MKLMFPTQGKLFDFMRIVHLDNWELCIRKRTLTASFSTGDLDFARGCGAIVVEDGPDECPL